MIVGIHDSDKTNFPNYALMKLAAWHKANGDQVEWFLPLASYDRVYSSKVFTFTPEDPYLPPDTIRGGQGMEFWKICRRRSIRCIQTTPCIRTSTMQSDI